MPGGYNYRDYDGNRRMTLYGASHTLNYWLVLAGISRDLFLQRKRAGWLTEDALTGINTRAEKQSLKPAKLASQALLDMKAAYENGQKPARSIERFGNISSPKPKPKKKKPVADPTKPITEFVRVSSSSGYYRTIRKEDGK